MAELNKQQQEAANGFLQFLFSKEQEMIISGGGGVGKTYLMAHMIDTVLPHYQATCAMMGILPEYDSVVMTATTNKAAEVLAQATQRPAETIHSFLALKVQDDFSTGRSKLIKTAGWQVHTKKIIFIDECSMIDRSLRTHILEGMHNCKIVYVGDDCQLTPVMESLSSIYLDGLMMHELTEPMRNAGQPALIAICKQLRATVKTGVFQPIQVVPGVIDWLDDNAAQQEIDRTFLTNTNSRILSYTNKRVMEFSDYIRQLKQLPKELQVGEEMINNAVVRIGKSGLSVEEEVTILSTEDHTVLVQISQDIELEVRYATLLSSHGNIITKVPIPVDKEHFNALVKYFQKTKNWNRYFHLKNTYPDLRPKESSTVHKSQGSTYDTTYIDLDNLSSCKQPDLAARLLYVAFTRAKNRVVMFGKLSNKYGGLLTV